MWQVVFGEKASPAPAPTTFAQAQAHGTHKGTRDNVQPGNPLGTRRRGTGPRTGRALGMQSPPAACLGRVPSSPGLSECLQLEGRPHHGDTKQPSRERVRTVCRSRRSGVPSRSQRDAQELRPQPPLRHWQQPQDGSRPRAPLPPSSGSKLVNATLIQRRAVGGPDCPGEARGAQQLPAKATLSAWEPGLQALSSTFYSSSWMRRYVGAGDTHRHRQNEEHAAEHAGLRGRSSHDPGTTLKTP